MERILKIPSSHSHGTSSSIQKFITNFFIRAYVSGDFSRYFNTLVFIPDSPGPLFFSCFTALAISLSVGRVSQSSICDKSSSTVESYEGLLLNSFLKCTLKTFAFSSGVFYLPSSLVRHLQEHFFKSISDVFTAL